MIWIHLVVLLALVQLAAFVILVGKARDKFGVKAPAISGNESFERYYRVQMNTIEQLVIFIPSILLASLYWSPYVLAVLGLVYLVGRILFFRAYVSGGSRHIPFLMSFIPTILFLALGIIGTVRALINT